MSASSDYISATPVARRSIWAQRRLDMLVPQIVLLCLACIALRALEHFVVQTPAVEVAVRTLWFCVSAAIVAALLLDNFAKSALFMDGTAAFTACALAFAPVALLFAFLHAPYTRSAFGGFALIWTAFQWALCWRAVRRREICFAAYDDGAKSLLQTALADRSAAMQHARLLVVATQSEGADRDAVDGIVVSQMPPSGSDAEKALIAARLRGLRVYSAAFIYELIAGRVALQSLQNGFLDDSARHPIYVLVKRLLDIGGTLVVGTLSLPLLLLGIAAVKLDSRGPALFSQSRYGRAGARFKIYKLRTMTVEHAAHGTATVAGDQRITRVGTLLRKYRIDELPQLWNVLIGDMSLIGPRPEWEVTAHELATHIPQFDMRLLLRPGITGWAQVHQGHVTSHEDVRTKLEFDLFYIRHMSFLLDLTIGWRTLKTVLTSFGAK
jgi:lipopolysaccharide/colanic/teichoic acid biosynthesis glycosyltransferase